MIVDEIRDGYWYVEIDALTVTRELLARLRVHAGCSMWREVVELPSTTSPILRGVFYPLRPENV